VSSVSKLLRELGCESERADALDRRFEIGDAGRGSDQFEQPLLGALVQPLLSGAPLSGITPAVTTPACHEDARCVGVGDDVEAVAVFSLGLRERSVELHHLVLGERVRAFHL